MITPQPVWDDWDIVMLGVIFVLVIIFANYMMG